MRLVKVKLHGYKRFLHPTTLNVGGKVTALIGLNEAGKSSVLSALAQLPTTKWADDELNMRRGRDEAPVLQVEFLLDPEDQEELAALRLADVPRRLTLYKFPDGQVTYVVDPTPTYDLTSWSRAEQLLEELLERQRPQHEQSATGSGALVSALHVLSKLPLGLLLQGVKQRRVDSEMALKELHRLADDEPSAYPPDDRLPRLKPEYLAAFQELRADMALQETPIQKAVQDAFRFLLPTFVLFRPETAGLPEHAHLTEPAISEAKNALLGVLSWGGVSPQVFMAHVRAGRSREARTLALQAQRQVNAELRKVWPAGPVEIQLHLEDKTLQLHVMEGSTSELMRVPARSQGLRTFLALMLFLHRSPQQERNVTVLIDELETHLHVDAQRQLVQAIERHPRLKQVLYTTHSPFALPSDLSAVREVVPNWQEGTSSINNHVWQNSTSGLIGLLTRMGASSATLTAARAALITEGETDFVLLPRMLAHALGLPSFDAVCLPGYAHAQREPLVYEEEAVRVAYLFDGDRQGQKYAQTLLDHEVPPTRVFTLEEGHDLEDYLHPDLYVQAVREALKERRSVDVALTAADVPGPDRPGQLKRWCRRQGLGSPPKTAVMQQVLDHWDEHAAPLDPARLLALQERARQIASVLGLSESGRLQR